MNLPARKDQSGLLLLIVLAAVAIVSALPYAGSANDGSRLSTVESLVDYHTWSIDRSIFVVTPGVPRVDVAAAYPDEELGIIRTGGMIDKLLIHGHYYSDKSPVTSLFMAAVYKGLQMTFGLTARKNPQLFCYLLALVFSGSAYVVSVWCIRAIGALAGLSRKTHLVFTCGFAFATVALPYVREVNNHILELAVFSMVMLNAVKYTQAQAAAGGGLFPWRLAAMGTLIGIGYAIDLGTGPVLVLCVAGWLAFQARSVKALFILLGAAFPWFLAHHALNYMIGGTFKPVGAVAAYLQWPGSPFTAQNITGVWAHHSVWDFTAYAAGMFFGLKGFICYNIPLYTSFVAVWFLLRRRRAETALVWLALGLILGTWLVYAIASNNYSGSCCSVRWFVPLLAPFYYLLALLLKYHPRFAPDLVILSAGGVVMGFFMWVEGPWMEHLPPGFWQIGMVSLVTWAGYRWFSSGSEAPQ